MSDLFFPNVDPIWASVDEYLVATLSPSDDRLDAALVKSAEGGLPPINVAPNQGKLLELLAKIHGSRRILEIGTLGGYSTILLARSLDEDGVLISLELEEQRADVARENIERAGLSALVDIRVGSAAESLRSMVANGEPPFDFIFIDADKPSYPDYLELSLELSRPGTVIFADNMVHDGAVIDSESDDGHVRAARRFLEMVSSNPHLEGTAIQTVGSKGYDGFALLHVLS